MRPVDGSPLAGQTIIRVKSGCAGFPRVTDGFGVATFNDVPIPGGYFKAIRNDDIAAGSATIRSDTDAASIALSFGGFGTITGTVVDAGGDPVHGADVVLGAKVANTEQCVLVSNTRARRLKTGPDGTFRFEHVSVGAIHVSASTFFLPIPASASANLLAHGDVQDFTLSLTSNIAGELSGTVYLPDGTTAAGPDVSVTVSGGRPDVTVRTDVNGRYSFAKIFPAGRYTVTPIMSAALDPAGDPNTMFGLPLTADDLLLSLLPRETAVHRFRVRAKLPGAGPMEEVVREGLVEVHALTRNVLPVGHTFVKGVDLFDGHLVTSSTDANIPGRGPALQVTRTYSSSGSLDEGPLGAGWNLNYHSRLIVTSCFWTIVGGDGSGQRFVRLGGEFVPQKGYHTSLRENDDGSFDFFTKGRIRYHYVNVQFSADRPNLDFIEDTNGNRLQLTYDAAGNIAQVQEIFAGDVVGRSLFFEYVDVLGEPRISKITGPLGLELLYAYDEWANLTRTPRRTLQSCGLRPTRDTQTANL